MYNKEKIITIIINNSEMIQNKDCGTELIISEDNLKSIIDELVNLLPIHDVSNRISDEEIKRYRKEGRLSGATKREPFYKLIAKKFDENYEDTDFDILYDC